MELHPNPQQPNFFRAMVENAWEVMACLEVDCTIRYITRSVARVLEYLPEELIGRNGFDFVVREDLPPIKELFEKIVKNVQPIAIARFRLIAKSGKEKWVQCTGINLLANPAVTGVVIYYDDITERKLAEDEGRKVRERLTLALKAGKMGTFDWNLRTDKIICSDEAMALHGFAPGEFKGTKDDILSRAAPGEAQRVAPLKMEAIKNGKEYSVEYKIIHHDGTEHWVMTRGRPHLDRKGNPVRVLGVTADITQEKRREQLIKDSEQRLRAASEAKSHFLANMSHEIRTPLGAILGFTDLIRDPGISQEDRMHYAEIVRQNGNQLATVINDILDISKVEAGKLDVQTCVFSLSGLVAETASFLQLLAGEKKVALKIARMPAATPDRVCSDPARVKQVLTNIIGNAIKFTRPGGEITVSLGTKKSGSRTCAIIEVNDTGIGMDKDQQELIFDAFFQADSSLTRKFGGTGLGLSLSKHLATLLGGDLELVESTPGKGSTFRFSFDLNLEEAAQASAPKTKKSKPVDISGLHVLLAEDSPDNQLLITQLLSSAGAIVDTVDNGQQAVDRAVANSYDVILMDIQMPVLDGYKATALLRDKGYKGKIVALTAHALVEEREHSFAAGCDAHLTKPVNRAKLIETIAP
jgi:PAS domain S-box-containing protein